MTSVPFTAPPTFMTEEEIQNPSGITILDDKNGTATRVRVGIGDGSRTVVLPTVGSEVVGTRGRGKGNGTNLDDGITGWNEGVNNITGFQHNRIKDIISQATTTGQDLGKTINVEDAMDLLNWGDARMGISEEVLASAIRTQRAKNLNQQYGDSLDSINSPPVGEGMSRGDVVRLLKNQQGLPEKRRKVDLERNQLIELAKSGNLSDNRIIRSGNDNSALNTYTLAMQQEMERNRRNDLALNRADAKDAKSMEYRLLQDKRDREDYRYAEDNKRFDNNKREELIRAAALGLFALNSSFKLV